MFALAFDSYQSTKIVVPLAVITLGVLFFKDLLKNKKNLVVSVVIGFLVLLPMLLEITKPEGLIRFKGTNLFSDPAIVEKSAQQLLKDKQEGNILGQIIHNRRAAYVTLFAEAYTSHLNPFWLSANFGGEQFKVPGVGLFYLFELPFLLLGVYFLFQSPSIFEGWKRE